METNNDKRGLGGDWREWTGRGPHWPLHDEDGEIQVMPEWWSFEWEKFDGSWILEECAAGDDGDSALATCVARLLIVRLAANAVRRDIRAEDLYDEIVEAADYLAALPCSAAERNAARRLLAALVPFDPEAIAHALLHSAWNACAEGLDATARSLAQLAYDAASSNAQYGAAHGAALALAHLAKLQECPRVARKWRSIAYLHRRRAMKQRAGP
jgi:hypothetical protein